MTTLSVYHRSREQGTCFRCKQPCESFACEQCKPHLYGQKQASRARKRARGECIRCSSPARRGMSMCLGCSIDNAERNRRNFRNWSKQRHADGLCISCRGPHDGFLRCAACRLRLKTRTP